MASSTDTAQSFPEYTFDLSAKLRQAAVGALAGLEASINRDGYDWLEDYLDNIQAQGRNANVANLIKTPSRTATAKKTRAALTATLNRAEQIKNFNARLALSPLADKSPAPNGRQPFSPLQDQSINSPHRLGLPQQASPSKSPLAKVSKLQLKPKAKEPKAKDTKGKGKAKVMEDENAGEPEKKKRTRTKKVVAVEEPKVATPRKTVRSAAPKPPSPVHVKPEPEVVEPVAPIREPTPEPIAVDEPAAQEEIDDDIEVDEVHLTEEPEEAMEVEPEMVAPDADTDIEASDDEDDVMHAPPSPSPMKKVPFPVQLSSPTKSLTKQAGSPIKVESAPAPATAPARQVRSSWLSQALGDRPVPVASGRTSVLGDDPLRKSIASASLKRKSEDGAETDAAEHKQKVARFDSKAPSPVRSSSFAARQPGSATSLPSANVGTPAGSAVRQNPTSVPAGGDKVSRALEELRERTAAAAATKQKNSAAAAKLANVTQAPVPTPAPAPTAASGSGFLRGLGNFGAGLLGLGAAAEDPEARRRREAEDKKAQETAEAELARIMGDMAEADKKVEQPKTDAKVKVAPTSEDTSDQMGDVAIVVDDESEDDDADDESDEADASFNLPELPTPDIGDEYDDEPFEDGPTSALGAAGLDFGFESTTPPQTPPLKIKRVPKIQMPEIVISPPPKETTKLKKSNLGSAVRTNIPRAAPSSTDYEEEEEEEEEEVDELDDDDDDTMSIRSGKKPVRSSVLSQAERMAPKVLGVKPATGPVLALQRAAEAAKREEAEVKKKAALKAQVERRKQEAVKRKEEAERQAAEEEKAEKKRVAAEQEARKQRLAEAQKRREETQRKNAAIAKEKERVKAEAEARARAEEDALRKSKIAASQAKQAPGSVKRIPQPTTAPGSAVKPLRLSKSAMNLASSSSSASTIKLVSSTSTMKPVFQGTSDTGYSSQQALQQSRQTLQAQLDQKASAAEASEDIVLPDIASEYSDSDESDKETDFKRPAWAESPELKSALERQATLNPDELFGSIRPLNMDELFKQRVGKFRARTSSANWSGADRLTQAEEREYARRMGFRAINAPRDGGASAGDR